MFIYEFVSKEHQYFSLSLPNKSTTNNAKYPNQQRLSFKIPHFSCFAGLLQGGAHPTSDPGEVLLPAVHVRLQLPPRETDTAGRYL